METVINLSNITKISRWENSPFKVFFGYPECVIQIEMTSGKINRLLYDHENYDRYCSDWHHIVREIENKVKIGINQEALMNTLQGL